MPAETWTYSVTKDPGRGTFFWAVWSIVVPKQRTSKPPKAHGWASTEEQAVTDARGAIPGEMFAIRHAHLAANAIEWKRFAAPGHTREDRRQREHDEYMRRVDAMTEELRAAKAAGPQAEEEWFAKKKRERDFYEKYFMGWDRYAGTATTPALKVLGLDGKPTIADIKSAYRKLALEHHPDRGGDAAKFRDVTNAYKAALAVIGGASG